MALPEELVHFVSEACCCGRRCEDCGIVLGASVLSSPAGFYIGTWCNCGPYSRESGYYETSAEAEAALEASYEEEEPEKDGPAGDYLADYWDTAGRA